MEPTPISLPISEIDFWLPLYRPGDADACGFRQRLNTGSDVDGIAVDVALAVDDVAHVDADAGQDFPLRGAGGVLFVKGLLDGEGAPHRLQGARELHQEPVA